MSTFIRLLTALTGVIWTTGGGSSSSAGIRWVISKEALSQPLVCQKCLTYSGSCCWSEYTPGYTYNRIHPHCWHKWFCLCKAQYCTALRPDTRQHLSREVKLVRKSSVSSVRGKQLFWAFLTCTSDAINQQFITFCAGALKGAGEISALLVTSIKQLALVLVCEIATV